MCEFLRPLFTVPQLQCHSMSWSAPCPRSCSDAVLRTTAVPRCLVLPWYLRSGRCTNRTSATAVKAKNRPPPVPEDLHLEQTHGHWVNGVHYVVMEVRDYELDQFQVVNNAVYASYVQNGRHKALASLNMPVERFQQEGILMALSDLTLQYKAPLRAGDTFYVTTAVAQVSAARVVIDHTVQQVTGHLGQLEKPTVVCTAQATAVFLDSNYRPTRVPPAAKQRLAKLSSEYSDHFASVTG